LKTDRHEGLYGTYKRIRVKHPDHNIRLCPSNDRKALVIGSLNIQTGKQVSVTYGAKELWSGYEQPVKEIVKVTIPAKDALHYKIGYN